MTAPSSPWTRLGRKINTASCKAAGVTLSLYLFVAFLQLQVLYPLHKTMDLPWWDEALYMGQGARFLQDGNLGPLSESPLYALFYSVLVAAVGRVDSIFWAQYVIKTFVSLALFCFLSTHLRSRMLALLLAMVWIVASINVYPGILVNQAAFGLFLLALVFIEKRQVLAFMLLCLCTLARLDYLLVLIAFAVYLVWKRVKPMIGKRSSAAGDAAPKTKHGWEYAAAAILAVLAIYTLVHIDDFNLGGRRTWFAFKAHYALLQVERGRFNLKHPYADYNVVVQADFPGADSLRDALLVNPRAFLGSIALHVPILAESIVRTIAAPYPGSMFWADGGPYRRAPLLPVMYGIVAGFFVTIVSLASFEPEFAGRLSGAFRAKKLLLYAMLMSLLDLVPILFVYPSPRYTLIMVPFLLFWPGLVCQQALLAIPPQRFGPRILLVLSLLFVIAIEISPKPFAVKSPPRPTFREISALNQLWPNQRLRFLGIGSTWYAAYLGSDKVTPIEPFGTLFGLPMQEHAGDLGALIRQYDPDVVLVNQDLVDSPNFQVQTLSALDLSRWSRCTIGSDTFYFKVGKVDTRFACLAN